MFPCSNKKPQVNVLGKVLIIEIGHITAAVGGHPKSLEGIVCPERVRQYRILGFASDVLPGKEIKDFCAVSASTPCT
jgi:hypothetical protein